MAVRPRLCFCCVLALLWAGAASAEAFRQWLPWESWAGGKQYDARLDKPVAFWRAGITLEEVLGSVREQTGVTIGFRPENDENRRVRVNLFLNPQQPPTLRDVMAQLSWVMDCPFSMSEENGATVYSLMSTSMGAGAEQALLDRRAARVQAREQLWKSLDDALEECRRALQLPREELIRRYRGRDDFLLLTLLDPPRRAAAALVCRNLAQARPEDWLAMARVDCVATGVPLIALSMTAQDLADLEAAFGQPAGPPAGGDIQVAQIGINVGADNRADIDLSGRLGPIEGPSGRMPLAARAERYLIVSLPKGGPLAAREEVRLRQLLGAPFTPEGEAAFVQQRTAEMERAAQERAQVAEEAGRAVSEAARQRLAGLQLPFRHAEVAQAIPLWQMFEEIAKASGYHIISDAFITGGVGASVEAAKKMEGQPFEAWEELAALTSGGDTGGLRVPVWEWGDAGSFLRFRTSNRDIYRAAMLPDSFLRFVDAVVRRPGPVDEKARSVKLTVPIELANWTRQLARLTNMQLQFSATISQTAPDDLVGNVREEVVKSVLWSLGAGSSADLIRFLGALDDAQWSRVRGEGISGPAEVTPGQMQFLAAWAKSWPFPGTDDYSRISVRIADTADDPSIASELVTAGGDPTYYADTKVWHFGRMLEVNAQTGEEREIEEEMIATGQQGAFLPKQVTVHIELPEPR